jgi:NADPH2:quinone reductase
MPDSAVEAPATEVAALVCDRLAPKLAGVAARRIAIGPPGPGELLVAVRAAALNFPDLLMCEGGYQFKPPLPFVPGMEGAGVVLAVGEGVDRARIGEAVRFSTKTGALAERIVVPAAKAWPVLARHDFAQSASWHVGAITAYVALVRLGAIAAGDVVLVHGATGGMGYAAIQLASHLGATVYATAREPADAARIAPLLAAGARAVLPATGFRSPLLEATAGRGADLVYDPVGGDVFDESLRVVAFGGKLLVIGFASGRIPTVAANIPLIKGFSVVGVRAGEYGRRHPALGAENLREVARLGEAGVFDPLIGARFPLARALDAMRALAERRAVGKIVVEMPGQSGEPVAARPGAT